MPALLEAPFLKPCPFCGCELESRWNRMNPAARCVTERCVGSKLPVLCLDVPGEIEAWNTRAVDGRAEQAFDKGGMTGFEQDERVFARIEAMNKPAVQPELPLGAVGEVTRHGLDSSGRKWHGINWYDPNVQVPHGTKLYTQASVDRGPVL